MKKSEWSDNELEQLLREMPKIKDHRDPRDIYQNLSIKANIRKRPVWIIPSVASAAAVLLIVLLVPNIWQNVFQDSTSGSNKNVALEDNRSMKEMKTEESKDEVGDFETELADDSKQGFSNDNLTMMSVQTQTAIYEEDLINQEVITYLIPDQNAQILVPVSLIVEKDNQTWLERFQSIATKLTEEQWGLSDYYPLNATLSMSNENTVNVDVPEGHYYGTGSANETSFISILQQTMNLQKEIKKITFSTSGKPGITLGNYGEQYELNIAEPTVGHSYYLFNPNNSNLPFLVPSIEGYQDIESALDSMKMNVDQYGLTSPITFNFEVDSSLKPLLVVTIEENQELTDDPKNMYAIESILLTAKEFGFDKVKFENSSIVQIGRFSLQDEIKVPIAPNKVFIQ